MTHGRTSVMVLVACLFCAAVVTAPSSPAHADNVAKAKKLFKQAEKAFADKNYAEALKLYQEAYENKPLAGFLLNIGQCLRHLGQCDKAIEHYNQYLAKAKSKKRESDVKQLIEVCEKELAARPAPAPEPEPEPKPEETPPELTKQPEPEPEPAPEPARKGLSPLFFWSGVGVTGVLLLTGTITGSVALSKSSEFKDPATPYGDLQGLKDSGEGLRTASTVTFVLGALAAAGTATLYFFTDFGSKEESVAAAPIEGGGILVYGGRF